MTHSVIKTNNYILLTSDEEIKEGDYYYDQNYPNQIYIRSNDNKFYIGPKKIIAHLPLGDSAELKIPLLPPLPMTFPTIECIGDNLWEELTGGQEVSVNRADWSFGFGIGYNKAKEKYKFTEEDVIKIVEKSRETGLTVRMTPDELKKVYDAIGEVLMDQNIVDLSTKSIFDYHPKKNIFSI